jgi:hypothetical protein
MSGVVGPACSSSATMPAKKFAKSSELQHRRVAYHQDSSAYRYAPVHTALNISSLFFTRDTPH